jgi:cytochrome b561
MTEQHNGNKHSYYTRLTHFLIAILVIGQLFSIYIVENRLLTDPIRTFLWSVHKYGGLVAFAVLLFFIIYAFKRRHGTPVIELFPWVSLNALKNLKDDIIIYIKQIIQLKVPEHHNPSPFASAIHGLGIIIMFMMATTGVFRFVVYQMEIEKTPFVKFVYSLHHLFADYAWIYIFIWLWV